MKIWCGRSPGMPCRRTPAKASKKSVQRNEKRKQIEKQIAALESKTRREKQLNRRMEINAELKLLRKQIDS